MKRKGLSWRTKLLVLLSIFSVLPLALLAYWVLAELEETYESTTLSSLEGLATAKAAAIEQVTGNRTRDVERMASLLTPRVEAVLSARAQLPPPEPETTEELPELQDAEALEGQPPAQQVNDAATDVPPATEPEQRLSPTEEELAEGLRRLRRDLGLILWDQDDFEELLIIDNDGRVLASTYAAHEGRSAANIGYFQGGRRTTFIQPVFVSPITERLTMVISTPMRDANAQDVGVLAARLNLDGLYRLINDTTGLGETGETVVAKIMEDELVFMAPTRHDPSAVLQRRIRVDGRETVALSQAALGSSGSGVRDDYRQHRVLAAWRPVPSLGWGLMVKMDQSEAMQTSADVRARTLQITLGILVMAIVASVLAARELVRPLRQLQDAADRISRGDLGVRLVIRSADEIGELSDSFERMVAAIKFFREHARSADEDELEEEPDAPKPEARD